MVRNKGKKSPKVDQSTSPNRAHFHGYSCWVIKYCLYLFSLDDAPENHKIAQSDESKKKKFSTQESYHYEVEYYGEKNLRIFS